MKTTKFNFAITDKKSDYFVCIVECSVSTKTIKDSKRKNKITSEDVVKDLISKSLSQWGKTKEGKDFLSKKKKKKMTLESVGELLSDNYYNKYIELRRAIKKNGLEKLRVRVLEIYDDWKSSENLLIIEAEDSSIDQQSVDDLANLLSKKDSE